MNVHFVPKGQDLTQDGDPRDGQYWPSFRKRHLCCPDVQAATQNYQHKIFRTLTSVGKVTTQREFDSPQGQISSLLNTACRWEPFISNQRVTRDPSRDVQSGRSAKLTTNFTMRSAMRGILISLIPVRLHGVIPKHMDKIRSDMGDIMDIQHSKYFLELLQTWAYYNENENSQFQMVRLSIGYQKHISNVTQLSDTGWWPSTLTQANWQNAL